MHILPPVTDNCSSRISGRWRMTVECFFMTYRTWGSNSGPLACQADSFRSRCRARRSSYEPTGTSLTEIVHFVLVCVMFALCPPSSLLSINEPCHGIIAYREMDVFFPWPNLHERMCYVRVDRRSDRPHTRRTLIRSSYRVRPSKGFEPTVAAWKNSRRLVLLPPLDDVLFKIFFI